jgi:glycosyltransferase involved in cell wall biosynthesis
MIRICHIQVLPLLSGVQRVMLDVFDQLDRSRYDIHVVCQHAGPLTDELARRQICYHLEPTLVRPLHPWRDLRAYLRLTRWLRDGNFDLVHTHSSKPGILGRLAASRAGVPCIVHHVHGFSFHEFSPPATRRLYARLEHWAGRHCNRVIFVNEEERQLAVRQAILPAEKCLTIYNGVDLRCSDPERRALVRGDVRRQFGWDERETVVLMMGRLDQQKQPLLTPAIAGELERLRPHDRWRIAIAGSGALEEALRQRVRQLGLEHRVQLLGWQNGPQRLYCGADIVLHPTLWEGLPLSLLDAQAAGLPAVASNVKGNREVVTAETGFLCEPQQSNSYAAALAQLIENTALQHRMGDSARQRAERYFDASINYRRIAELYDELLDMPTTKPSLRPAA